MPIHSAVLPVLVLESSSVFSMNDTAEQGGKGGMNKSRTAVYCNVSRAGQA